MEQRAKSSPPGDEFGNRLAESLFALFAFTVGSPPYPKLPHRQLFCRPKRVHAESLTLIEGLIYTEYKLYINARVVIAADG
jgi:hypothetical protein